VIAEEQESDACDPGEISDIKPLPVSRIYIQPSDILTDEDLEELYDAHLI